MIWTLCSWLGATKFSICCIPILIFVPLPEKKHHINIWKWTICMFIVYIMCSWLTAAKFGSNNFSWTKKETNPHEKSLQLKKACPKTKKHYYFSFKWTEIKSSALYCSSRWLIINWKGAGRVAFEIGSVVDGEPMRK